VGPDTLEVGQLATGTPRQQGFRMPAEWEPHAGTWIAWPHNANDWPGKFAAIPWVYAEIVRLLAAHETVNILVNDEAQERRAAGILKKAGANLASVRFHLWKTDRVWLRDSGPIFLVNRQSHNGAGKLAITEWKFNAWAKYDDWRLDDQIPEHVAQLTGLPRWQPVLNLHGREHRLVLEGGSIDVNGQGTLITTEECLLSEIQQRNPGVRREQLEGAFHDYLGIDQVIWLDRGTAGDDTHGHVDDITRFVAPEIILAAVEPDRSDENHAPLAENLARLKASRTPAGKQWTIVEMPMPRPVVFRGQRLPASYANFYIANDLVLMPTFHDPRDRVALVILSELFPDREVVGVHAVDLIWGLGALHCMTQQQPAADFSHPL
jgi:agmatine deiminase